LKFLLTHLKDLDYLREAGTYLTKDHGLCNVGQWHSHHKINLFKPSVGDENTVWSNMPNLGLDRYIVFIANIANEVTINCFLFQIKKGEQLSVKHGKFEFLDGNSPVRLNEKVLQNVHSGAESFNAVFETEMEYIRNKDATENRDISNENETSSYTVGNRVQHVTSVPTKEQKHTNRTAGKKTTSYVRTVQNTSKTIRHERHFNPQHVPTATPSRDNEEQLSNAADTHTPLSGQQREKKEVVRVTSSEIPNETRRVTLETKKDQKPNLADAVLPNFSKRKHNQIKVDDNQGYTHHGNTNFGRGSMTSTTHGTDQEFRSDANRSLNSAESNYELNMTAKQTGHNPATRNTFETRKRYVASQVIPIDQVNKQDISNQPGRVSLDQQRNRLDQVSHGTMKAGFASQKHVKATVTYHGGQQAVITHQPSDVRRDSFYDNVKTTEPTATPMDIDETQTTITGHEVNRPDTPSGTIENIASDDQVADSDDDVMFLCGLFKKRKVRGSDK
jgi:hypothetical protein